MSESPVQAVSATRAGEPAQTIYRAGQPSPFATCAAIHHPAAGDVGIVMIPACGYEGFVMTRAWRILAERLAVAGYPVIRFDLPGTGDSLDSLATLDDWHAAVDGAAEHLTALSGTRRILFLGQSIGAALALEAAKRRGGSAGAVLLAPVLSGRLYLRETAAFAALSGIDGFALPATVAAGLNTLDHTAVTAAPTFALVTARPGREADHALAARIGAAVLPYDAFDDAVTDPTTARVPSALFTALAAHLTTHIPPAPAGHSAASPAPHALVRPGFSETAQRFGPDDRLYGILCQPHGPAARAAVLFVNAGRDCHTGWSRITVDHARALAGQGIASFRFGVSATGESADDPARAGEELLYSAVHSGDVAIAAKHLAAKGFARIVVTGRCSGGYAALHAARHSPEVAAVVPVNLLRLVWDPRESVADAIRADLRPAGAIALRALDPAVLKRLLKGEVNLVALTGRVVRKLTERLPALPFSPKWRLERQIHATIATLLGRRIAIRFISSRGDAGSAAIARAIRPFKAASPKISLEFLENADHNLNQPNARRDLLALIADTALSASRQP